MAERPNTVQQIEWREVFLFTRIFKAFRVAIRPSKMLLALAALLLMYGGGRLMDAAWPQRFVDAGYELRTGLPALSAVAKPFASLLSDELGNLNATSRAVLDVNWGYPSGVAGSVVRFAVEIPVSYWIGNKLFFTALFAWYLVVWAIFGGAICRTAAIHVTRDEVISPRQALKFSLKALPSFIGAPLIPFLMVLFLGVLIALMGLVLYIPYVGPMLSGALLVVPMLMALLMTFLVVGSIAGSGLMYPTIAVEGSDAFDALSRALSHVFAAPWRLIFYCGVGIGYGALTYYFVRLFVFIMLSLVHFFAGWFLVGNAGRNWESMWPTPEMSHLAYHPEWSNMSNWGVTVGAGISVFWIYLAMSLLGAYVISFYFSASTIIYLMMRRKVDATEMDAIYMEAVEEQAPETPAPAKAEPSTPAAGTP